MLKGIKVRKGNKEYRELLVLELKEQLVPKVFLENLLLKELKVRKENKVLKELRVFKDYKELKDYKVYKEHKED